MKASTDYTASIFYLNTDHTTGRDFIQETTLADFLKEFCEGDPARAWYIRNDEFEIEAAEERYEYSDGTVDEAKDAVIGTRWEVRERDNSRMSRSRLIETFETEAEAEEYVLNGLYWNYCNLSVDVRHADTSEELEAMLIEDGVDFTTPERIDQLKRAINNRIERRKIKQDQELAALAGDDAAVLRAWWASETYHPAPKAVIRIKERLGLNWKQVRAIAKSQPSAHV